VAVEDRLAAPNEPATLDALRPALDEAVARVLGAPPAEVVHVGEPDGPFEARVLLEAAAS